MSERKYTDEEIVKALECCINADCLNCPRWSDEWYSGMCNDFLKSVLDLIKSQKAEIEKLQEVNADLNESLRLAAEANKDLMAEIERLKAEQMMAEGYADALEERAKAEAIREFAERLKETPIKLGLPLLGLLTKSEIEGYFNHTLLQVRDAIDNLVAEMTEGK